MTPSRISLMTHRPLETKQRSGLLRVSSKLLSFQTICCWSRFNKGTKRGPGAESSGPDIPGRELPPKLAIPRNPWMRVLHQGRVAHRLRIRSQPAGWRQVDQRLSGVGTPRSRPFSRHEHASPGLPREKRGALKFNDAKTIAQIDAGSFTIEPEGGNTKPSCTPLLVTLSPRPQPPVSLRRLKSFRNLVHHENNSSCR